jgi:two-component system cell cycle response regulator
MRVLVAHRCRDASDRALRILRSMDWETLEAATAAQALACCRAQRPDVVLLDAELCRPDDVQALSAIKGDVDLFTTAVVVLARDVELDQALEWIRLGAHDFLRDDAAPGELVARVESGRRTKELQDLTVSRMSHLEDLIFVDALTGLYNRRFLERQLAAMISSARRHDRSLAVAMLDLDHFKAINDTRGHQAGDHVLEGASQRLSSRVRTEDVLGRWGGEEFLVLLPDLDGVDAEAAAEAFRQELASEPIRVDGDELPVTVSVGWAAWEGESAAELVARADAALYAAKRSGRNCTRQAETSASSSPAPVAPPTGRFLAAAVLGAAPR